MHKGSVAILGGGSMGTAIAILCAQNGCRVRVWTVEDDVASTINTAHHNHAYLPDIALPLEVQATGDMADALDGAEAVISALPAQVIKEAASRCAPLFPKGAGIMSVSKGFVIPTGQTAGELWRTYLPDAPFAALMGPLFAREIAEGIASVGLLASEDAEFSARMKEILVNSAFRVRESADVRGAECNGALKNIYAIGMGIMHGAGFGWNTKSALMTMALEEMASITESLGGQRETAYGLSGLGDLITTGFGEQSRNRRFGEALCTTSSVAEAIRSVGQVVEGVKTLEVIDSVLAHYHGDAPFLRLIKTLSGGGIDPCGAIEQFITAL